MCIEHLPPAEGFFSTKALITTGAAKHAPRRRPAFWIRADRFDRTLSASPYFPPEPRRSTVRAWRFAPGLPGGAAALRRYLGPGTDQRQRRPAPLSPLG